MTKRIFRSIFLVALVVLLLSVALLSVVFYNDYAVQYLSLIHISEPTRP